MSVSILRFGEKHLQISTKPAVMQTIMGQMELGLKVKLFT